MQKTDTRYRPHRVYDAVEVEALGQSVVAGMVRAALDELLPEPIEDVLVREQAEKEKTGGTLDRLSEGGDAY